MGQYTVVCEVELKDVPQEAFEAELDGMVEAIKAEDGFVSGQWVSAGTTGFAIVTYDDEAAARAWEGSEIPPEATVALRRVTVCEVIRSA